MTNKFNIVLCELFHPSIHGLARYSSKDIQTHYISSYILDPSELDDYNENNISISEMVFENDNTINGDIGYLRCQYYWTTTYHFREHPYIRNYFNIIKQYNYIKPEIAQCILLETGESIVILKTFWLRIIQRKWKKEYKCVLNMRKKINSLNKRELTGKWPKGCRQRPSIYGLFYKK
jgi:hypothetical protein